MTDTTWYPTISGECDNCNGKYRCVEFCPHEVYKVEDDGEVWVSQSLNCLPGCTNCATICPRHAIKFPTTTIGTCTQPCACSQPVLAKKPSPFQKVTCNECGKTFLTDIDGKTKCFDCEHRYTNKKTKI